MADEAEDEGLLEYSTDGVIEGAGEDVVEYGADDTGDRPVETEEEYSAGGMVDMILLAGGS